MIETLLVILCALVVFRIIHAELIHRSRQRLLNDLATMIGDIMDAEDE